MKFRMSEWVDTRGDTVEEFPILFGIQAKVENKWVHCHENGEPLIYKTIHEASAKMETLIEENRLDG